MWRAIQNASRLALAGMAFAMVFFLTPRSAWISGAHAPSSSTPEQVPVDRLEDSDSCLWCDQTSEESESCLDREASEDSDETCTDDQSGTGPSA